MTAADFEAEEVVAAFSVAEAEAEGKVVGVTYETTFVPDRTPVKLTDFELVTVGFPRGGCETLESAVACVGDEQRGLPLTVTHVEPASQQDDPQETGGD